MGVPAINVVTSIRMIVIASYPTSFLSTKDTAAKIPDIHMIWPLVSFNMSRHPLLLYFSDKTL
ncbi:hypothetical protein D3C81_1397020 [compost metagenome]